MLSDGANVDPTIRRERDVVPPASSPAKVLAGRLERAEAPACQGVTSEKMAIASGAPVDIW